APCMLRMGRGGPRARLFRYTTLFRSAIQEEVDAEVLAATDDALAQPQPGADTVHYAVYSPDVDPTGEQFDTEDDPQFSGQPTTIDRKSTRLNSSHVKISYAVFCLKNK